MKNLSPEQMKRVESANNIMRNVLGSRAFYMLGAEHYFATDNGSFQCKIHGSKRFNYLTIEINGNNLINLTLQKAHGKRLTGKTIHDLPIENLHETIERETGLAISLGRPA